MANRVFIYSDEEARKNGNYTTLGRLFLALFVSWVAFIIFIIALANIEIGFSVDGDDVLFLAIVMIALSLIYGFSWRKKYFPRLSCFATDTM